MKIQQQQNLKLYKSKEGKTITFYTFCVKLSDEREKQNEAVRKTCKEAQKIPRTIIIHRLKAQ